MGLSFYISQYLGPSQYCLNGVSNCLGQCTNERFLLSKVYISKEFLKFLNTARMHPGIRGFL